AAREADELGQQVIENGLSNDLRAEAAASRLEELCGGAVDLDGLVRRDLDDVHAGACASGSCDDDYVCRGGQCICDPMAVLEAAAESDPGAQRLFGCLGDDSLADFAALGTKGLCLWRRDGNENIVCDGATPCAC